MKGKGLECTPSDVVNLKGDAAKVDFINYFKEVQKLKTQIEQYTELNQEQRQALQYAVQVSSNKSLIPSQKNYIQQLKTYERETSLAKLSKMHGLRHEFAQNQYHKLTSWACPAKGGTQRKDLTQAQRKIDKSARLEISKMLGHERVEITAVYLGG